MSYRSSVAIENFEAEKFAKKIRKQVELVEGKILLAKKRMETYSEEEEHHKQYRRVNYLERYKLWLEECIQDLDDIHKGVPWKHIEKCGSLWRRSVSSDWYEWKDPKTKEEPKEPAVYCTIKQVAEEDSSSEEESDDEIREPQREIRNVSKQEALLCLGYTPEFIAALNL
ncbi:conserved hypothetical protein [Lausannevirus]|uniref:Uncharacterized protein n=1 Tax=Lausannevirus TaxID=999883 RepID=F2WL29_9VIRU|nr:hypothetical protein LAU_0099 [Lausannevirus]AEA06952.1 conserved hypothetical protein [Lausannevirus]